MIKIQATFSGYGGKSCTLFSAIDPETSVLVISKETNYRTERLDGCIVITNAPNIPRDSLFVEDDIAAAISAYYSLKSGVASDNKSPRLVISDGASRSNPDSAIEMDGIDGSGTRFRISDGVTSSQIAALATCLYATKADSIEQSLSMFAELDDFMGGGIITI